MLSLNQGSRAANKPSTLVLSLAQKRKQLFFFKALQLIRIGSFMFLSYLNRFRNCLTKDVGVKPDLRQKI